MGFWIFGRKKNKAVAKEAPLKEEKKEQVTPQPATEKKETVNHKPVERKEATEDKQDATKKQPTNKYHISQNKDDKSDNFKKWRVRKEGSDKTIKFFDTQAEAIKFAEGLADNNEGSIVIHKVDGSIRKQDYTKK